ncbi:MAG: SDR family NAD(P)-dependent oxidoreductase [Deltaproteobacteria bacterium]|nr:SDR family NAD(P)-dependent oxidoreductase [Deltaproteobacteria bacterium]MBW2361015.1 SDR family NAD(P)-dependent oxidoreductase [Deltaproteobacteria bacterium]
MSPMTDQPGAPLSGRVAIVTGAGRGIGRATAHSLARHGARVVVNDFGGSLSGDAPADEPAARVAEEIATSGGEARANSDSVAEWPAAQRIIQTALDAFGRVDLLVNNAGLSTDAPIWELDPEVFDRVVRSHLYGGFHCLRAAVPHMKAQGFGRIVNLVSRAGLIGTSGTPAYGAAKGGLFGLTNVASRDLAGSGVTVNAVNPSATETRMVTTAIDQLGSQGEAGARRASGLRQALQAPERVAALITALCLDAAGSANGQTFYIDKDRVGLFQPLELTQLEAVSTDAGAADLVQALARLEPHALGAIYED